MRAFRGDRSQKEFADVLGVHQSVVSERLENANYGKSNLSTLFDTAATLNVAVFVRFVDFETFLELTDKFSDNDVRPKEYNQDAMDKLTKDREATTLILDPSERPLSENAGPRLIYDADYDNKMRKYRHESQVVEV